MAFDIEHDKHLRARGLFNNLKLTSEVKHALDKLVADAVAIEEDLEEEDKNSGDKEWNEIYNRLYPNDSPEKKVARINREGPVNQIQWLVGQGYTEEHIVARVYSPLNQAEWMTQEEYTQEFITSHIERLAEYGWSEEEIRETLKNLDRDTSSCPEPN